MVVNNYVHILKEANYRLYKVLFFHFLYTDAAHLWQLLQVTKDGYFHSHLVFMINITCDGHYSLIKNKKYLRIRLYTIMYSNRVRIKI